ncbi:MAG: ABC transporter permease [Clostridium chrysemydis]|uniref:ABC transporter permease n=1 Tax=Clostridium chrysemydis TaxID=2665504 RepID=UPI003F320F56
MNFKAAIKNIKRSKFGVVITILLITIGLLGGYISINTISTLKGEYKYVENYFNGGNVFSINANFNYYKPIIDKKDIKIYENIYNEIKNIRDVDILHYEKIAINLKSGSKSEEISKVSNAIDMGDSLYLEGMGVTEEVIKHYDLEIESGKFFNQIKRKNGVIDIVIGNNLKDAFQIGEEFEDTSNNRYRVIGIMKKDMEIPIDIGKNYDLKDKKFKMDDTVICNFKDFIGEEYSYYLNLSGAYIHMDKNLSNLEIDTIRDEIKQIFLKYGMVVNIKDDSKGIFLTLKGIEKKL